MKKIKLILVLIISISGSVIAQDHLYFIRNARLQVYGEYQGESLIGETKNLEISLDYETSEIILKLNLNNLIFNVDSLNGLIKSHNQEIKFIGKLSLDHIITDEHLPLIFTMEGEVEIQDVTNRLMGTGKLSHIDHPENIACMMELVIIVELDDFKISIPNLENEMVVVIKQAILRNYKN